MEGYAEQDEAASFDDDDSCDDSHTKGVDNLPCWPIPSNNRRAASIYTEHSRFSNADKLSSARHKKHPIVT